MLDFKTALETLRTYLKKNDMRFTTERMIILEEIFNFPPHFDAEKLFIHIRSKYNHISRATVYRALELFDKIGIIKKLNLGGGVAQYELKMDLPHHDHLICVVCGKVIEFVDDTIERLQREIAEKHGMEIINHQLQIYGRCKEHRKQ